MLKTRNHPILSEVTNCSIRIFSFFYTKVWFSVQLCQVGALFVFSPFNSKHQFIVKSYEYIFLLQINYIERRVLGMNVTVMCVFRSNK